MNSKNSIFERMLKEAQDELASGEKTWREMETNILLLACFGMLYNSLVHKIIKPLRWIALSTGAAVITYIVSSILAG